MLDANDIDLARLAILLAERDARCRTIYFNELARARLRVTTKLSADRPQWVSGRQSTSKRLGGGFRPEADSPFLGQLLNEG